MAWSTPRTWSIGETVTVDFFNAQLRDNFNVLTTNINTTTGLIPAATLSYFDTLTSLQQVQNCNVTAASNVGVSETTLISYTLPANTMTGTSIIRITSWGTVANSANAKAIRQYFGAQVTSNSPTINLALNWILTTELILVSSTTQYFWSVFTSGVTHGGASNKVTNTGSVTPNDITTALTVKVAAVGGASSEITANGQLIELMNA